MYVSFEDILAKAVSLGQGWRKAIIELGSGDTIWHPASTKKVITGRGQYVFMIHPSSVDLIKAPPGHRHILK